MVKPGQGFTRHLGRLLHDPSPPHVLVDGPYGPMNSSFEKYNTLIMVTSGFGIVSQIPYIKEALQTNPKKEIRVLWEVEEYGRSFTALI